MKQIVFLMGIVLGLLTNISQATQAQVDDQKDPYLWLENTESEKSLNWVRSKNEHTEKILASHPIYDSLYERYLSAFNDKEKIAYPVIAGKYVYNYWQDENYERGVLRRMLLSDFIEKSTDWENILNLDELAEKENRKWVLAHALFLEPQNNYCLLYLSDGGTDKNQIREFDLRKKEFVKDGFSLKESKGGACWVDRDHLLVFRDFGEGTVTNAGYPRQIRLLARGNSIQEAPVVLETDTTQMGVFAESLLRNNKTHTFLTINLDIFNNEYYYFENGEASKIQCPNDAQWRGLYGDEFIVSLQSDWASNDQTYKKGSLVSFDFRENLNDRLEIKPIFEPSERSSFTHMESCDDFIVVKTLDNIRSKISRYELKSNQWHEQDIGNHGMQSVYLLSSDPETNNFFYSATGFLTPTALYYGDAKSTRKIQQLKNVFDAPNYVVEQFEATSKDGTRIPYFIIHEENIVFDGQNPTIIMGYGGFNVSVQPYYDFVDGVGWYEKGGVIALANIRGGGEFGPAWHEAAMKGKRQNAFDDFFAVTEDIIKRGFTSPEYLGAFGWSNGGLLAGVAFTQRPELYNAVVMGAPLLDMKRYSKLLAGASWVGEYGDPENPEDWKYLKKYSPYHNLKEWGDYPEPLIITSTKDDRVHPGHARKMAAKLENMGHPFLLHETIEGGHGAAITNAQKARVYAYMFTYFNMKLNSEFRAFK